MDLSDEAIVEGVLAGKREMYAQLVVKYQGPVFNLMCRYAGNDQDAADLTQDVFVRAFDRLRTFRQGHGFFPWLYTMALNRARDWSRARTRRRNGLDAYRQDGRPTLEAMGQEDLLSDREALVQLEQALAQLAEETREMLLLRYRQERSIREVALAFQVSESAAKMRIKRGLAQVQEIMQEMERDG